MPPSKLKYHLSFDSKKIFWAEKKKKLRRIIFII
jgi:hypothetical protein